MASPRGLSVTKLPTIKIIDTLVIKDHKYTNILVVWATPQSRGGHKFRREHVGLCLPLLAWPRFDCGHCLHPGAAGMGPERCVRQAAPEWKCSGSRQSSTLMSAHLSLKYLIYTLTLPLVVSCFHSLRYVPILRWSQIQDRRENEVNLKLGQWLAHPGGTTLSNLQRGWIQTDNRWSGFLYPMSCKNKQQPYQNLKQMSIFSFYHVIVLFLMFTFHGKHW